MGLLFDQSANSVGIAEPEIVDMCIAPIDSEVTGCLYVTASTMYVNSYALSISALGSNGTSSGRAVTYCYILWPNGVIQRMT